MNIFNSKNKFAGLLVCSIISILVLLVTRDFISPFKTLELKSIDQRFKERGDLFVADSSPVVIVEITQETYDQIPPPYNDWPWPRWLFTNLIENLNEAGARAIGIDIVMSGPDQFNPANDTLLMNTIKKYGNVVVAGQLDIAREQKINRVQEGRQRQATGIRRKEIENYQNIFYEADSSVGIVNVANDYDGVHRRYMPYVYSMVTKKQVPTFAFALLNKYWGNPNSLLAENRSDNFYMNGIEIPKYNSSSILINYYSLENQAAFKHRKFINILDDSDFKTIDEIDYDVELNSWEDPDYQKVFKDKIVLIGSTMAEDKDHFPVSISRGEGEGHNLMYGVLLHATAVQNILNQDFIYSQSERWEIIQIIFFTFLMFYLTTALKRIKIKHSFVIEIVNLLLVAALIFILYQLSVYFFIKHHVLIALVSPAVAIVIGYFGSTAYHFIKERQQSTLIKGMFSHYVSNHLVNELIENPDMLKLGGEKKNLTLLFSDIVGFSSFSEKMTPEELVHLINEYLSAMTEIVLNNNGTLDKYIGDAVMAFWGAPIALEDHAYKACLTAIQMRKKLVELQEEWKDRDYPHIDVRIGLNSGEVVVGNMGGEQRFDYTVMGDEVNLASRLEGVNKQYGTFVMISDVTQEQVSKKFVTRELDTIRVKGRATPTVIYELIGLMTDTPALEKYESLGLYFQGLREYKNKHFREAAEHFGKSFEKIQDPPSQVYLERCKFYIENSPAEDWDGVFTMTTK